jgi:hypothetical protein
MKLLVPLFAPTQYHGAALTARQLLPLEEVLADHALFGERIAVHVKPRQN